MPLDTREAFRQKTVDDFLVAAGYFVGVAASNSTGNNETKQGEAGAAYLTALAAASPAADAAIEEASLNFTARRHGIASFLCVASQIASLDAAIRCALVLHPDFPVESKTISKCNEHVAFVPISSLRFMPV